MGKCSYPRPGGSVLSVLPLATPGPGDMRAARKTGTKLVLDQRNTYVCANCEHFSKILHVVKMSPERMASGVYAVVFVCEERKLPES